MCFLSCGVDVLFFVLASVFDDSLLNGKCCSVYSRLNLIAMLYQDRCRRLTVVIMDSWQNILSL